MSAEHIASETGWPFWNLPCIYVPDDLCRRRDIRQGDKLLYGFVTSGRYTIPEIARAMEVTPRTIKRRIKKLRLAGVIVGAD